MRWGGDGRKGRGEEGRGEGKGEGRPPNVRDALTPLEVRLAMCDQFARKRRES